MSDDKSKKVYYMHLRPRGCGGTYLDSRVSQSTRAKGGRTVAYRYDDNGVTFAIAKVNPSDVYCKAIGREVSSKRLAAGPGPGVGYWPGTVESFRGAMIFTTPV